MSDEKSIEELLIEHAAEQAPAAEPAAVEESGAAGPDQDLARQLAEANQRSQENWERYVRTQAELENHRRRAEKDLQQAHKFALEKFAKELLAVVDSLELGFAAAADSSDIAAVREGMELTLKQFRAALEKFQIREVNPLGEKFNPELHQAMAMEPSGDAEPNSVLKVFQKGYLLNERLLRPALVVIAAAATETASAAG